MKDHQLLNDFSTSLPWLQHRMQIFSAGLNRWSRQRLKRESLHAELIVADLREFEIPETVDLLVASYIIHHLPEPYAQAKTWQAKVRPGGICSINTRGRFPHDPDEVWFPADIELKRLFEGAGWLVLHAREEDNWNAGMERQIRGRAAVAVKPETS